MDRSPLPAPGARIEMDGMLNLRDLGGWATSSGRPVARGILYRSDRLSALTDTDLARLDELDIDTVVDLRYDSEVVAAPSRLWGRVGVHRHLPIAGELAQQKSFVDRVFDGEFDEITDADVADSYVEMLDRYGDEFGQAAATVAAAETALFHCTAGKDRTGLLAMLLLSTVGVANSDIVADFDLSNRYRAQARIAQLRPEFEARGLDIERYRAALSAPLPAMRRALEWIASEFGSSRSYLSEAGGLGAGELALIERRLTGPDKA